MSNIILYIFDP